MQISLRAGFGILAAGVLILSSCSSSNEPSGDTLQISSSRVTRNGEIYLFRGLANVFSLGIDTIGEKMVNRGLNAKVFISKCPPSR